MISAIAARKAVQGPAQPVPIHTANEDLNTTSTRRSTKRKASQKAEKRAKKARKSRPFERSNGWNGIATQSPFPVGLDLLKGQQDLIIMDSEREDTEMSISDDGSHDLSTEGVRPEPFSVAEESSEDGENDIQREGIQLESLLPQLSSVRSNETVTILSTFKPTASQNTFFVSREECSSLEISYPGTLVCLTAEDTLCLFGNCRLTVLSGSLEIFGSILAASKTTHRVYAPRHSPLPIIRSARSQNSASVLGDQTIPDRLRGICEFNTVVLLQSLETGVEGLGRIFRPFDGIFEPSRWQKTSTSSDLEVPGLYMVLNSTKDLQPFILPSTWSSALDAVMSVERDIISNPGLPGLYIVKGPKNSGKSTFAKTLVNRLLDLYIRVAFLECDIGQPEFTPPGIVSLNVISQPVFGPPFTHPTLANYAHFVGSSTPRSSPSHYLEAISSLIETYRREIQMPESDFSSLDPTGKIVDSIPLVVNTMGWTKGLGGDINRKIEDALQPTDIFEIRTPSHEMRPDPDTLPGPHERNGHTARIHLLEPASAGCTIAGATAADHRNISILSYFHSLFDRHVIPGPLDQITAHEWDVSRPLCAMAPFEVDCSIAFDKIFLTGAGSEDVVDEEVSRVLNGAVVGLVACDHGTIDGQTDSGSLGLGYTRGCEPPSPLSSKCVGLGIVRAVSSLNQTTSTTSKSPTYLHLLTPVPYALLSQSRVLVKGELELPIWGMLDFRNEGAEIEKVGGMEGENIPYLQWGKAPDGVFGADKRKIRRNLMRRGQL